MNGAFYLFWGSGGIISKDRDYSIELDAEEKMLLNRILNKIFRAAVRLIETEVKLHQPSTLIYPWSSNSSTWPVFRFDSMDTSLDKQN